MATFWVLMRSRSVHANLASASGKPLGYGNRPDLVRELGERSRKRALERFSADRILPRYETLYRRVIGALAQYRCCPGIAAIPAGQAALSPICNRQSKI